MQEKDNQDYTVFRMKISDELDLHSFRPEEIRSVIGEYLEECIRHGITRIRIIHGKGKGILRRTVHAELERNPLVVGYHMADGAGGHWGATIVYLDDRGRPGEST